MSNKVDLKTMNNDLSIKEMIKLYEETPRKENTQFLTIDFANEITECLAPVLNGKSVANKNSGDIPYFMSESIRALDEYAESYEYIEKYLLDNMNLKTYSNWYKSIIDSSILLIGKIFLQHNIHDTEIDELMIQIKKGLCNVDDLRWFLDSWLYYEAECTNSEDYADLCDVITEARKNFLSLYDNYKNIKFEHIDLKHIPIYAVSTIEKTSLIYEKLLELSSKIVHLDFDDKLYPYIYDFNRFGKRLANTLFYLTGQAYMDLGSKYYNEYKMKNAILKHFDKLERRLSRYQYNLSYIFRELNENCEYGSCTDKAIFNSYRELKNAVNKIFISF